MRCRAAFVAAGFLSAACAAHGCGKVGYDPVDAGRADAVAPDADAGDGAPDGGAGGVGGSGPIADADAAVKDAAPAKDDGGTDAAAGAGGGSGGAGGAGGARGSGGAGGSGGTPVMVTMDFPVTEDADIDSTKPNQNNGSLDTMLVDGATTPAKALWRADLSAIPTMATVVSAELHITTSMDTGDPCFVFEVLESWSESQVTWTRRTAGTAWASAGAEPPSRGTTMRGGPIDTSKELTRRTVALDASMVAGWVANPASNHGAALVMNGAGGATFRTRNDGDATRRPFLRVTYRR